MKSLKKYKMIYYTITKFSDYILAGHYWKIKVLDILIEVKRIEGTIVVGIFYWKLYLGGITILIESYKSSDKSHKGTWKELYC